MPLPISECIYCFESYPIRWGWELDNLFEDLTIGKILEVPGHVVFDLLLLLLVLSGLNLGEVVGLVISGIIDFIRNLLTADYPVTRDVVVVGGTTDNHGTESVLVSAFKTSVETTDQVVGHEGLGKLIVVLVVSLPDGETLGIVVFPEPLHGNISIVVGVHALPGIHDEGGGRQKVKSTLGLGLRLGLISFLIGFGLLLLLGLGLLLLLGLLSSSLLLLLGGSILQSSFAKRDIAVNSLEVGLVDNGVEVTVNVLVLSTELLVEDHLVGVDQRGGNADISEADLFANQIGLVEKDLVEDIHSALDSLNSIVDAGLEVRTESHKGTKPTRPVVAKFIVSEEHPLLDKGTLSGGGTEEISVVLVGGDVVCDSRGLEKLETISTLESGDLTGGELLEVLGALGSLHGEVSGDLNFEAVVAGSNQGLSNSGVVRVRVDFLKCSRNDVKLVLYKQWLNNTIS